MIAQTTPDPTAFLEYGPVWGLVAVLVFAILAYLKRQADQSEKVANQQVATLQAMANSSTATSQSCETANDKLDAHSRMFETGLAALKLWAQEGGDKRTQQHVENIESQLRSDLARIK